MAKIENAQRVTLRFTLEEINQMKEIQKENNISSLNETISFLLSFYEERLSLENTIQKTEKELTLIKKYFNIMRKDNYVITALLNAICLGTDITIVPDPSTFTGETEALQTAREYHKKNMKKIMTRINDNNRISHEDEEAFLSEINEDINDE